MAVMVLLVYIITRILHKYADNLVVRGLAGIFQEHLWK